MSWKIVPGRPLEGEITVPGDKSVTHRSYLFAAMASGQSTIYQPLSGLTHFTDGRENYHVNKPTVKFIMRHFFNFYS